MIGYAGLTHLGIVSSVAAAAKGLKVVGFDEDAALVSRLAAGELPIVEPGLQELLAAQRDRVRFTADLSALAACSVVYVSVDVPTDDQDRSDVRPVERLLGMVASATTPGTVLVVLSQVPPGFCRARQPSVAAGGQVLYYQVETLIFGIAVERASRPERLIVGCADPSHPLPPALASYLAVFDCPILPMRYESAELCKISINMFLVASVATTNMLAEICEAIGADWREIAPALRLDARIGSRAYLSPGLGVGGGNLTRDLATIASLAAEHGTDAQLVSTWRGQTEQRRDWVLRLLHGRVLGSVANPVVAVWGLAYKENTQSVKNSPGVELVSALGAGGVRTRAYDPGASLPGNGLPRCEVVSSPLEACAGADALAVMTPWPQFADADLAAARRGMRGAVLVDPFGRLDPARAAAAGFHYFLLGSRATA